MVEAFQKYGLWCFFLGLCCKSRWMGWITPLRLLELLVVEHLWCKNASCWLNNSFPFGRFRGTMEKMGFQIYSQLLDQSKCSPSKLSLSLHCCQSAAVSWRSGTKTYFSSSLPPPPSSSHHHYHHHHHHLIITTTTIIISLPPPLTSSSSSLGQSRPTAGKV